MGRVTYREGSQFNEFADLAGAGKIAKDFEPEFLLASGLLDGVHDQIQHANGIQIKSTHDLLDVLVLTLEEVRILGNMA